MDITQIIKDARSSALVADYPDAEESYKEALGLI